MPGTTLQDVIVPELFNPYVINRTMELSALLQCGIIVNSSEFDTLASQAAPTVNMPFFEDLTGESEQVIEARIWKITKLHPIRMWRQSSAVQKCGAQQTFPLPLLVVTLWALSGRWWRSSGRVTCRRS